MSSHLVAGFLWRCRDGRQVRPADMRTAHLFYTVRAIFNATVPAPYRVAGCRVYTFKASPEYLRLAVVVMLSELKHRLTDLRANGAEDLSAEHCTQLAHMADVCRQVFSAALN